MQVSKASLMCAWFGLIGLTTVARLGIVVDGLLVLTAGWMAITMLAQLRFPSRIRLVMITFLAIFAVYATQTIASPGGGGLKNTIGIGVAAIFFLYFTKNAPRYIVNGDTAWVTLAAALIIAFAGIAIGSVGKNTVSGIASYLILTSGLLRIARGAPPTATALIHFMAIGIVGATLGHRAMAGLGGLSIMAYLAMYTLPSRFTRALTILAVGGGIFMLIAFYAGFWGLDIRIFNDFLEETSGRNATSGRQIIWPIIVSSTMQQPWTGLGPGMTFGQLYNSHWSAHNYFLQTFMQTGFPGLVALCALLLSLWWAIGKPSREAPLSLYVSCCMLILMIHMSLEVFLMQVNLIMGCSAWMMLGLGIGILHPEKEDSRLPDTPDPGFLPDPIGIQRISDTRI